MYLTPCPDTSGTNYFAGVYTSNYNSVGAFLFGTDWGENILFSKIFFIPSLSSGFGNTIKSPDGALFSTGFIASSAGIFDYLMVKTNASGQLLWAKKYRLNQISSYYRNSNFRPNISFAGNNLYMTVSLINDAINFNIVAKLDLDGNIIWSRSYNITSSTNEIYYYEHPVIIKNDTVITYYHKNYINPPIGLNKISFILSKLNASTGNLIESTEYFFPNQVFPDIYTAKLYNDNSISFTGNIATPPINSPTSNYIFSPASFFLDSNYNIQSASYYTSPMSSISFMPQAYGMNSKNQQISLISQTSYYTDNFFLITGPNNNIFRTRKFYIPPIGTTESLKTIDIDDKENVHFNYNFSENNRAIAEYARISDLAPSNTLNCFGRDTAVFTAVPMYITKAPFTWNRTDINPIISLPVNLIEAEMNIQKTLICKQVSRCDSMHIDGLDTICKNQTTRYTLYKNPECLKSLEWNIDTSLADIINTEGDTAVTLSFKRSGYLRANVYNCIVKDSLWITVTEPKTFLKLTGENLLCPGQTNLLSATAGFKKYLWQDASTLSSFLVTSPGIFRVIATDSCGNIFRDSIIISPVDTTLNLPASTEICATDTAFFKLPNTISNISWQPTSNTILRNKTLLFFPGQTTNYTIFAEAALNCFVAKWLTVKVNICPQQFFMPNSFTPNNDGINDIFKPSITGSLQFYNLTIFNRYGQKIFETRDRSKGWDGTIKQAVQPIGTYVWNCTYQFANNPIQIKQGYCLLLH
jgi:gliding motility-associated-like protein